MESLVQSAADAEVDDDVFSSAGAQAVAAASPTTVSTVARRMTLRMGGSLRIEAPVAQYSGHHDPLQSAASAVNAVCPAKSGPSARSAR